jgi:hypothetical protein
VFTEKGSTKMTNANSLLKKAELFERLAVYGGRRAFLRSFAFDLDAFNAALSIAKKYLADAKNIVGGEAASIPEPTDVDQIASQIDRVMKLADVLTNRDAKNRAVSNLLGARTSLKRTKELAPQLPPEPAAPAQEGSEEVVLPQDTIHPTKRYPSVPKDVQQKLGLTGKQVDGILGPETRRRLDAAKLYLKLNPKTPDSEVFKKIMEANFSY